MPQRTTPFQAVVHLVRQHYARPGVTVTESKMMFDPDSRRDREVDIVVEAEADGEPMVISLEVNEKGRRASVDWAEQQIGKHRRLPTHKLVLVSKSGFTAGALTKVESEGGWVEAVEPEIVTVDGEPVVKRLLADSITFSPTRCTVVVVSPDQQVIEVAGQPETDVYDSDVTLLGILGHLVAEALALDPIRRYLWFEARHHPERDTVTTFQLGLVVAQLGYHLQQTETGDLHQVLAVEVWGIFSFIRDEVHLTLGRLGGRTYAAAEQSSFAGRPVVWVGTTDEATQTTTLSWRATDGQAPNPPAVELPQQLYFPGLKTVEWPRHPEDRPSEEAESTTV
ncbi:hypothetical protein ACIA5D_51395 [Actinoplanes sp. NPDC051513]|uniref:hypothetical protein n=1 Tax=Actinoplanes sp. NPDC051513 TaxID=3363908 RepID=UPI0037B887E8